jgi:hypothetical protein
LYSVLRNYSGFLLKRLWKNRKTHLVSHFNLVFRIYCVTNKRCTVCIICSGSVAELSIHNAYSFTILLPIYFYKYDLLNEWSVHKLEELSQLDKQGLIPSRGSDGSFAIMSTLALGHIQPFVQ